MAENILNENFRDESQTSHSCTCVRVVQAMIDKSVAQVNPSYTAFVVCACSSWSDYAENLKLIIFCVLLFLLNFKTN